MITKIQSEAVNRQMDMHFNEKKKKDKQTVVDSTMQKNKDGVIRTPQILDKLMFI